MEIVITWYDDSMRSQVISMFEKEYQLESNSFKSLFSKFYFYPFQKDRCLLIVAMDGKTVAGFQSFFYWPYVVSGKKINSFQSGNSIVHPDYRGRGIFQKMLAFIEQQEKTIGIDLLLGFPVEASFKNFIKDKWQNIFNLQWYLKPANPFAFLNSIPKTRGFSQGLLKPKGFQSDQMRLSTDEDFFRWRENYSDKNNYYTFTYSSGETEILFHLKKNKRKKILNELIIGNIVPNSNKAIAHIEPALKQLLTATRWQFHFVSIAINEEGDVVVKDILKKLGFRRTEKSIYFIVKPFTNTHFFLDPRNWVVYRSDIDTW